MNKCMLWLAMALLLVGLAAASAFAQTTTLGPDCTLEWDAYTQLPDSPAASFKLYIQKNGVQLPNVTGIPISSISITCKAAGVVTAGTYVANLHAVAADGTESDPSNGITWMVKVKPSKPINFRVR